MTDMKSKGTAAILAALLGPFGADKFYVGATSTGVIQLILTLTVIGSFVSIPWAFLSTLTLVLAVILGSSTFLYPTVNWSPTTQNDKIIGWIIIGVYIIGLIGGGIVAANDNYKHKKDKIKN